MRPPAYLLLPIIGAVVLAAAVLGSWLWPEPVVPSPSPAPPVVRAPVVVKPSPPPPAVMPPRPKPEARPAPTRPVEPPPQPVVEPVVVAPPPPEEPPPGPTTSPRMSDWSPEKQAEVKRNWGSVRARAAELASVGLKHLERQRDEARARGDQAEYERLDQILRTQRERIEQMRRTQPPPGPGPAGLTPEVQAGPPMQ